MPRTNEICNTGNNSTCTTTSAHETGTPAGALTGNPFTDLSAYGIDLHGCTIRYRRGGNRNGNTLTGRFNISGRETTAGGVDYETLIHTIVEIHRERCRYVAECHRRRRERYRASWLSRHSEMVFRECTITFM